MQKLPGVIHGGYHKDERGILTFFNDLDLTQVKRVYIIEHPDIKFVRAWQGHKVEQKWFIVIAGSFKVVAVQPDDWNHPSQNLPAYDFTMKASDSTVLHIPGNYANGIKALEPGSKIMTFSNFTITESANDSFRFDKEMWYDWNEL